MNVLQINTTVNSGSTGRITESIGEHLLENGDVSTVAYGRRTNPSKSKLYKVGSKTDQAMHLIHTRLFDTHGFHSKKATNDLVDYIIVSDPDLIHLHNLHGYYLHIDYLFKFLKEFNKPVVWTLHDCWAFTGHCCHYLRANCEKWKTECFDCPLSFLYPRTILFDNSRNNFNSKKSIFTGLEKLQIVTVSEWLKSEVKQSFLKEYPVKTIYNGIDTDVFKPNKKINLKRDLNLESKKIILGVANDWAQGKGLKIFMELSTMLTKDETIVLLGLNSDDIRELPDNMIGIERTNSVSELVDYYNMTDVFVTPSIAETFGLVVAEALACGTPCVVNNTSALPELINPDTGIIAERRDAISYHKAINNILEKGKGSYTENCRNSVLEHFTLKVQKESYYHLYQSLLNQS